jgi:hypothetical protein
MNLYQLFGEYAVTKLKIDFGWWFYVYIWLSWKVVNPPFTYSGRGGQWFEVISPPTYSGGGVVDLKF